MQKAADTILEARTFIISTRVEIDQRRQHPKVTPWQAVNFDLHGPLLPLLDLPVDLKKLWGQMTEQAQVILTGLAKWENEIGNLEIDIRHATIAPQAATAWAADIANGCATLEVRLQEFREQTDRLLDADQHLRDLLSLAGLLPLAKACAGQKERLIDQGFQVFCALSDENSDKCEGPRLHDYLPRAVAMQDQLKAIELAALPGLAADVVARHVGTALAGADQIKQFVENAVTAADGEFKALELLKEKMATLREAPVTEMIAAIGATAESLGNIMLRFNSHAGLLAKTAHIDALLQNLRACHDTIKQNLLAALLHNIQDDSSPLHPGKLAREHASDYFMGLPGVIRMVKILLKNLTGGANLNEDELARKMEQAIVSCTLYCSNNKSTINMMEEFINSFLAGYSRPFPYDGVFRRIRLVLGEYGNRLEKFLDTFPTQTVTGATGGPATLGRVLTRIETRVENLRV